MTEPGWGRLLAAARRRLERTGGAVTGSVSLRTPTDAERRVVIGVTGVHRPPSVARLTVRLDDLDGYLRQANGKGLVATLDAERPLRNRRAETAAESEARDTARHLAEAGAHADTDWYQRWLAGLPLTRIVRGGVDLAAVVRVLDALPAADEPLLVFAERVLGDTKALTDGPVRGLVLRALVQWRQAPAPRGAEDERRLWESVGVVPDDLASQVLVLNAPAGGGLLGDWLSQAAVARVPLRVTLHQLRRQPLRLHCDEVFVCENPAVLRSAADRPTGTAALVCTEGVPSAAVHALLAAAPDAVLFWRNDFDWPGVRMTATALTRYRNARPWRMAADDYRRAVGAGPPLSGTPAATPWDERLADAMRTTGRAAMEERLLPLLLGDLARPAG